MMHLLLLCGHGRFGLAGVLACPPLSLGGHAPILSLLPLGFGRRGKRSAPSLSSPNQAVGGTLSTYLSIRGLVEPVLSVVVDDGILHFPRPVTSPVLPVAPVISLAATPVLEHTPP